MGGERCRRGECRGERVIMEAGIIIGVTKERGDPRKWWGGDKKMTADGNWKTMSTPRSRFTPSPPFAFLPSGICLFLSSPPLLLFPSSLSSLPPPVFFLLLLLLSEHVDGTPPQCQPLSPPLSPSLSLYPPCHSGVCVRVCSHVVGQRHILYRGKKAMCVSV